MQTILPNSLNQLLRSYLVVFLPYPFTQTQGLRTLPDMLINQCLNLNQTPNHSQKTIHSNHNKQYLRSYLRPQRLSQSCTQIYINQIMKKDSQNQIVPNLNELNQPPFLKRQSHQLKQFKDKEKFVPVLRSFTYQNQQTMSQMFVYSLRQQKKDGKVIRSLQVLTQKEVITVEQLFQLLNENLDHKEFSSQVRKMKEFQHKLYQHIEGQLAKNLIFFQQKNYLTFSIYYHQNQFFLKGSFNSFNYKFMFQQSTAKQVYSPQKYVISNFLVKQQLMKRYQNILKMSYNLPINDSIAKIYKQFYEHTHFLYDQFIIQLQVLHNYPILRIKNYVPVRFNDYKTDQVLEGPIFSNANPECMYEHFLGYNADTIKFIEGEVCQNCQLPIEQLQQNQLLMMLRDNVFNPLKQDIFYLPEFNRFKLMSKVQTTLELESQEGDIKEQRTYLKTEIKYLNYSHFRMNLKKITNKHRSGFSSYRDEEVFPLTFKYINREIIIMDPARGKYCQHYSFTDLRLYYLNYDPMTKLYTCPVEGCQEVMPDSDILYLREVLVLIDFATYKCQNWMDLLNSSKIVVQNNQKKVYLSYKARQQGVLMSKIDQIPKFYSTLIDPYVTFPQYTLGIKQKQRKQRMNDYMFKGWREQMQAEQEEIEEEDQED